MEDDVLRIQAAYPVVYHACHVRHRPKGPGAPDALSERDARILAHLHGERGVAQGELAEHLAVQDSTLSEALDSLEAAGLVRRRRSEGDRRRVEVSLTGEGVAAMSLASVLDPERLGAVLARLTADERRRAVDGLELLARAARNGGR